MPSSNSTLLPIPKNIAFLTGPPLLGIMLNWCLFGVLIVQVYVYRLHFPNDRPWLKRFVYIIFVLELIQTGLSTADAFHWFVYGFGNMETLATAYISAVDAPIMNSFMAYMVQLFYGWRLWILSKSRPLVAIIIIIGGTQAIGGLVTGILTAIDNRVSAKEVPSLTIWLAGSVVVDIIIAAAMTYYLLRARGGVRLTRGTDDLVLRIVRLTIETNSLSAGVAIITLVTYVAFPNDTLSFCPSYVLGKVYTNSVMVALNNRVYQSWKDASVVSGQSQLEWSSSGGAQSANPKAISHDIAYPGDTALGAEIQLESFVATVDATTTKYSQV